MQLNLTLGPLALFAFVASITPGPNNLLLMRSGASFGIRRSLWHLFGVQVGLVGLLVLSHGRRRDAAGAARRFLGAALGLCCLPAVAGVMILRDAHSETERGGRRSRRREAGRPMNWLEAVLFQLINPKAWMMAITVASAFYGSSAPALPRPGRCRAGVLRHRRHLHAGVDRLGRLDRSRAEAAAGPPRLCVEHVTGGRRDRGLDAA